MSGFVKAKADEHMTSRAYEVFVPLSLARYGRSVRAVLTGDQRNPAIVVLGGISGDRHVYGSETQAGWWPGLVGDWKAIDAARHAVLGVDFAADETGCAAPTTAEQAEVLAYAMDAAGIAAAVIVGASYGGMVALRLAADRPSCVAGLVVISADAAPHPMATAYRELQRRIVALGIDADRGADALAIARGLAMCTYRSAEEFGERFAGGCDGDDPRASSDPGAYLRACGDRFAARTSPGRFLSLSASIDRHRVDPHRIIGRIAARTLLIGASSDQLVPPGQMRALEDAMDGSELHMLDTLYGHDMFLKEPARIAALVAPFLEESR